MFFIFKLSDNGVFPHSLHLHSHTQVVQPAGASRMVSVPQEAVDLWQRANEDPRTFNTAAELAALAARWQGRWPGPMARSAAACLTVAGVREGLLEALDTTLRRGAGGTWQVRVPVRCSVQQA